MVGLASWVGLTIQSWWNRCWPRLPELLEEARGRVLSRTGSWQAKGPSPIDMSPWVSGHFGGLGRLLVLE